MKKRTALLLAVMCILAMTASAFAESDEPTIVAEVVAPSEEAVEIFEFEEIVIIEDEPVPSGPSPEELAVMIDEWNAENGKY